MNIILFLSQLPSFSKHDIDCGNTPPLVYELIEACRCAFFLSHAIRQDVNFVIHIYQDDLLICYQGDKLRYLGPDERSQALILRKALLLGRSLNINQSMQSTPGLRVWKGNYISMLIKFLNNKGIICNPNAPILKTTEIRSMTTFIARLEYTPLNLRTICEQLDLIERAFPPPYNVASLGTQILYLHHVRDLC